MSNIEPAASGSHSFSDLTSLPAIHTQCWENLTAAVIQRDSGWRLPVLATSDMDGCRQRVVVLRHVDVQHETIYVHTDLRSAKITSIQSQPQVSWLFYDAAAMVQLQLSGKAVIHTNDTTADRFWNSEPESSLRGYLAPHAPGTVCNLPESNLPASVIGRIPERDELQLGRANFAVISCKIQSMEWLLLRREGNLKARFQTPTSGDTTMEWLAP
ncbi:MAG: pyridoxamine 5'-phosphate oxidase family protein [Fuerstiella sp.]